MFVFIRKITKQRETIIDVLIMNITVANWLAGHLKENVIIFY